jgi:hypothetical protein
MPSAASPAERPPACSPSSRISVSWIRHFPAFPPATSNNIR